MQGNWQGRYKGTNSGQLIVELDDCGEFFRGCVYAYDDNPSLPTVFALIQTPSKASKLNFKAPLAVLDPQSGEPCAWEQIAKRFPEGISAPKEAEIECEWSDDKLKLLWKTDIGSNGDAELPKSDSTLPSACMPEPVMSWKEFKDFVIGLEPYRYIFRGQSDPWRLRTPFHRTGRGDMRRFFLEDVPMLHRHLSARTAHLFNLSDPLQNAAFLHLAQHHGYPTPLLDWTYSPFVAAYFAYRNLRFAEYSAADAGRKVRIFMLGKRQWCADLQQILTVSARWPHFSIVEPIALSNERLIPQQALSSFTTVDDIEGYIRSKEKPEKTYLKVFDLPLRDRPTIVRELNLMGISAGSLFPGLDGACEELKERFFKL